MKHEDYELMQLPNRVARLVDEDDMTAFIQEALIDQGTIITEEEAKEVSEVAFDYIVMKLSADIQAEEGAE